MAGENQKELYKGQIKDLNQISSLNDQILRSEKLIAQSTGDAADAQRTKLKALKEASKVAKSDAKILTSVAKVANQVGEGFQSGVDKLSDMASEIPVVGKSLSSWIENRTEGMGDRMQQMSSRFTDAFTTGFKRGEGGLKGFKRGLDGGMKSLTPFKKELIAMGPVLAVALSAAVFALAIKGFSKLEAAAKSFREETGLLNSQMGELRTSIANVKMQTSALGASAEDVAKSASAFTNEFEGVVKPSEEVLANMVVLEKNFGIAAADSAKVNQIFQSIGGLSERSAQATVSFVAELSKAAGVAPARVMKDIAENAETASLYFGGSVEDLSKAAVKAARLGTSLTQAAEVSSHLLDFENSINAELEASAMLGQTINFNKARELAANGKILDAQQSVLDTISQTTDLNRLNTFQLQKLATASGMPLADLQKQLKIRQKFGKLSDLELAGMEAEIAAGKKISDISDADLAKATERAKMQQEMQSEMDRLSNAWDSITSKIEMAFAPLAGYVIPVLVGILSLVEAIVWPFAKLGQLAMWIQDTIKGWSESLGFVKDTLGVVWPLVKGLASVAIIWAAFSAAASVAKIPFVGWALAPVVAAGILATGFGVLGGIEMAQGGVVKPTPGGTSAIIGEGGEAEAVVPLSKAGDMGFGGNSQGIISAIQQLGNDIKNLQVQVNMDGRKVSSGVSKVVERSNSNEFGVAI